MSRRWLSRVMLRLVPRAWRDTVGADLEEEARTSRRGRLWFLAHSLAAGVRLHRLSFGDTLRTDVTHAVRSLARSPGYTTAAVLTFALGIGANIAVFAVIDRMMFRPLPYGDADRLVHLHAVVQSDAFPAAHLALGTTAALRQRATSFSGMAIAEIRESTITIDGLGEEVRLAEASHDLLRVLQVAPISGRDFVPADVGSTERLVLLADNEWQRRFNRSPDVFSRDLFSRQGSREIPYRIVGILPRGFLVPSSSRADRLDGLVLTSLPYEADVTERSFQQLGPSAVARLAAGISLEEAQAEVDVIVSRLKADFPGPVLAGMGVHLLPVRQGLFQFYRSYAWLIVGGVALVLLIACVNLAALLLAKGRGREHDLAVRVAIGASPWRVVRLVMIESLLLCGVSAAGALVGARVIFAGVLSLVPAGLRDVAVDPFDPRLIGIALAATAGSGVLAALLPAARARRVDVLVGLRQNGRGTAGRLRGGATLMAIETALGVLLVTGAATTIASFAGMAYGFPGFDEQGLYGVRVNHGYVRADGGVRYTPERVRLVLETIRSAPGIDRAGAVSLLTVGMERRTSDAFWRARGVEGFRLGVSEGYFDALGTPFLAGRDISASEVDGQERVALVSRSGAAHLCPGGSAADCIGRRIDHEGRPLTIVGVVEDITSAPGEAPTAGLYLPMTLEDARASGSAVEVAVRVAAGTVPDPTTIDARLDVALGSGSLVLFSIAERTAPYLQRPRFQAALFAALAVIALLLATIGLYALAAFDVARRRREMGIRLTLGATARDLRRAVVGTAIRPVIAGAAAGLVVAWWAAQFLQAYLFEVDARDPWTLAIVACTLLATAVVAAWLPARRAARTDPASVLRAI